MLILTLEAIHFPMTKIRKPFKNNLTFQLKKKKKKECLKKPIDRHEESKDALPHPPWAPHRRRSLCR